MGGQQATLAATSPARVAAYFSALVGIGLIGLAVYSLSGASAPPLPFVSALCVVGAVQILLARFVVGCKRAAWAFSLSLHGTCAVVLLLCAPKIRDYYEVNIALALIPTLVFAAIAVCTGVDSEKF